MRSPPAGQARFSFLRNADYRVLWCVGGLSELVRGMELLVLGWLVLQDTDDPFQLGLILVFNSLPRPIFSLFTGFIADRFSRLRILIISQTINVLARIHRWTGMDGVRTAEGGEGVTGAMIRARIWVDGRLAGGL